MWRLLGSPLTLERVVERHACAELWNLIRGAAPIAAPPPSELGAQVRRAAVGQPGAAGISRAARDRPRHGRAARPGVRAARAARTGSVSSGGRRRRRGADARSRRSTWPGVGRDHALDALAGGAGDAGRDRAPPGDVLAAKAPGAAKRTACAIGRARSRRLLEEVAARRRRAGHSRQRLGAAGTRPRAQRRARRSARPRRRAARRLRGRRPSRRARAVRRPLRRPVRHPSGAQSRSARSTSPASTTSDPTGRCRSPSSSIAATRTPTASSSSRSSAPAASASKQSNPEWRRRTQRPAVECRQDRARARCQGAAAAS